MKLYIKILVIVLFFAHCNMFFYKKNQPIPYLSFIEGDYFAEVLLQWKERLEHPLSGTTKKKGLQNRYFYHSTYAKWKRNKQKR